MQVSASGVLEDRPHFEDRSTNPGTARSYLMARFDVIVDERDGAASGTVHELSNMDHRSVEFRFQLPCRPTGEETRGSSAVRSGAWDGPGCRSLSRRPS